MKLLILDKSPAYIPFLIQCTKGTGDKIDPTVDNLIIFEEAGADAVFDATQYVFDPAKINAKTGMWGVLVSKATFTAGRYYYALWEMTVDGITTAKVETYFAINLGTEQSGDCYTRLGAPAGVSVSADLADIHADLDHVHTDLATIAGYIDTEITQIIDAVAALQADLGDPSADATTIYARLLEVRTQVNKMLFDANSYIKSAPQTAVTVNPLQVAQGMLQDKITEYSRDRLKVRRGSEKKFTFTFNAGFPLAGTENIYFTAKKDPLVADVQAAINKLCTITSAPLRTCEVSLTALEMTIDAGVYKIEVTIFDAGDLTGATARKPIAGEIEIEQNVRLGI